MKNIKKQIIVTAIAVFIGTASFAQNNDVTLINQAQVDAFSTTTTATEIMGNLVIQGGTSITDLDGLNGLTTVGGNFFIISSNVLTSLSGLSTLTSFDGNITIQANIILTSLVGLEGIESINQLVIANNPKLTNLSGLDNLTHVTISVGITSNETLTSLEGLEELTTIGNAGMFIYSNATLSTLNGLENLTAFSGRFLIGTPNGTGINPNPLLTNFCAISQLVTGATPAVTTDRYFIANNGYNPTYAQLGNMVTCEGITQDGDLTLTTQEEIDMVADNIIAITGNLKIKETTAGTITSLNSLANITSITGNLEILDNAMLETLEGLGNLATLGGELRIGTITGEDASLNPNAALVNFCAISGLVTGDSAIEAATEYFVENNAYNPTHAQLGNSETCVNTIRSGSLTLSTQIDIDNFTSTPFTGIAINLTIKEASAGNITSLSGLTNITSITGNLAILENTALTSLEGLGNLATLGGQLQIGTITGEDASLMPNMALIDFCAISDLVTGASAIETTEYFVENNAYNPTYMGLASGNIETEADTNDGCSEFGTAVVSTNTFSKEEDGYRLFPNPVSDVLFVKSESKITSITVSNLSGQEVLKSNSANIHVGNLSKGIYFARIVSGEKTVVEKFVKL